MDNERFPLFTLHNNFFEHLRETKPSSVSRKIECKRYSSGHPAYGNGAWKTGPGATGNPGLMIAGPPRLPANDTVAKVKKGMRSFMMVMVVSR